MDFGDFDDDLFETNSERKNKDFTESIKSYKAKQIIPKKIFEQQAAENLEESSNLLKIKGDFEYFSNNYKLALSYYEQSLELSKQSVWLNDTMFQRELTEGICRCLIKLDKFDEALSNSISLIKTSTNFEHYSTSLKLNLDVIEISSDKVDEKLTITCKLILMHPMLLNLWVKLFNVLVEKFELIFAIENNGNDSESESATITKGVSFCLRKYVLTSFWIVNTLNKYTSHMNEVTLVKRKLTDKWIQDKTNFLKTKFGPESEKLYSFDSKENIIDKLEKADKRDDSEKVNEMLNFSDIDEFFEKKFSFCLN